MLRVALTGNYGMGKSLALEAFRQLGAFALSADAIVADLLNEKKILDKVREIFGDVVFEQDGRLIKTLVARIIFIDQGRRKALEELLHPLVFIRIEKELADADARIAIIEVPLLFEGGHQGRFDYSIAVYTDFTTVLSRLKLKGITRDDILLRHSAQLPAGEKIRLADFSIDNNGTHDETVEQIKALYGKLLSLAESNGK